MTLNHVDIHKCDPACVSRYLFQFAVSKPNGDVLIRITANSGSLKTRHTCPVAARLIKPLKAHKKDEEKLKSTKIQQKQLISRACIRTEKVSLTELQQK